MSATTTIQKPSSSSTLTAVKKTPTRPYRDFLTPALHRRFIRAVGLTLCVCYVEAVWMGEWDILWQWFPFGRAGVRTLLLFISSLAVFILRVAQIHVGSRTTVSPFETFYQRLFRYDTFQTLFWYSFSAWWFSEVYIWSTAADAKLGWIDPGKSYERPKLNERPIFIRTLFLLLAVAQAIVHLAKDYDRISFPVVKTDPKAKDNMTSPAKPVSAQLVKAINQMLQSSIIRVFAVTLAASTLAYPVFLRRVTYHWTYLVAKRIFQLPKASKPSSYFALVDLVGRFFIEGLLLTLLWEFVNAAFTAYVAQEPMKKDKLLTDDSKDPNGSLLLGLKSKKEVPKSFAFWELALLTSRFPERRATIYEEIDRIGGSTWSQILNICLAEITKINERIKAQYNPPASSPLTQQRQHEEQLKNLKTLPKIAQPLKSDPVLKASSPPPSVPSTALATISDFAKSVGQTPGARPLTPAGKKLIEYGKTHLLTSDQQKQLQPATLKDKLHSYVATFLRSPLGAPFRQTFRRRVNAIVHGVPHSAQHVIVDAVGSLTRLAECSLKEDSMGTVQRDVITIMRAYVSVIKSIEGFVKGCDVHWTDVDFDVQDEAGGRRVPEVERTVGVLKEGLERLVVAFGEYLEGMGMSRMELKEAKELVGGRGVAWWERGGEKEAKKEKGKGRAETRERR